MPKQSQEKQLLKIITKLQDTVENLAGIGSDGNHINSFAFNELSKLNMEVFNDLKGLFNAIGQIKHTSWYMNHTNDPNYHKRQVLTRKDKINKDGYRYCSCGDWISERNSKYWEEHQKRNSCVSNRFRIAYDTSNWKLKTLPCARLDALLVLNAHLNELKNNPRPTPSGNKYSPYGMYCIGQLMRRRYIRNL